MTTLDRIPDPDTELIAQPREAVDQEVAPSPDDNPEVAFPFRGIPELQDSKDQRPSLSPG